MDNDALNAIFEQINNLKKPETEMSEIKPENKTSNIKEILMVYHRKYKGY